MDEATRQQMAVDIACVGFGPAMGGFLTTLSKGLGQHPDGTPAIGSKAAPGLPLQVVCYERGDDVGFGVSGVATRARGIRATFPTLEPSSIPMAHEITSEKLVYLLDPGKASRRSIALRAADALVRAGRWILPFREHALELPYIPPFLRKDEGLLLSIGQFNQWVSSQLMATGQVQIWPGMPVSEPLVEGDKVVGIRLVDQGTDAAGKPDTGYAPGMDIRAELTVVGDGPVGPVGRRLDERFGLPEGHARHDWAVGMKMVIELAPDSPLKPGTVIHTFGYPEPEIFGFLYVHADRLASVGIFVPSWLDSPVRTSYRYLQHWMLHPYLWPGLKGGTMRSWGAKSLQESGRRGEPRLVGDGWARIGEGSGSTNVLTGSGVDEAWTTGVQLGEGVLELLASGKPFTRANLDQAYVKRRRESWLEKESQVAARSRDGFHYGLLGGLLGMGLTGMTRGALNVPGGSRPPRPPPSLRDYYRGRIPELELDKVRKACAEKGESLHDAVMERGGWPAIPFDGKLLVSHQDALLLGGKVQAPPGYANHVVFVEPKVCEACSEKVCIEVCSGQAIAPHAGGDGVPRFDREKCVHCGACIWSCTQSRTGDPERGNIEFRAGAGGLHSAEN